MDKSTTQGYITAMLKAYMQGEHLTLAAIQSYATKDGATEAFAFADLLILAARYEITEAQKAAHLREAGDTLKAFDLDSLSGWLSS